MIGCEETGINWVAIDGPVLRMSNGQDFQHEIVVDDPWPVGTVSWLEFDGVVGHFADGVLSSDRTTFRYRVEAPGNDDTVVADRARYRFWVTVPNADLSPQTDTWKWYVGEVRRKDD